MVDKDTVIGVVYLLIGVFGVMENVLTAALISGNKNMKNPTYTYIVQACICDAVVLLIIAVLAGLLLLFPVMMDVLVCRIGAYIIALGWYPGCYFMAVTSVTRWLQLEHPHKVGVYFGTRVVRLTIGIPYGLVATLYTWFLYADPVPFTFSAPLHTWGFDRTNNWGECLAIVNIVFNCCCASLIAVANARSVWHIHRTRLQVMNITTSRNRQREVKLFVQCAITGMIYILACVYFFVVSCLKDAGFVEYLITHLLWICNHIQQPVVYMALNSGLRQSFIRRLLLGPCCELSICRCCKSALERSARSTDHVSATRMNQNYSVVGPSVANNLYVYCAKEVTSMVKVK